MTVLPPEFCFFFSPLGIQSVRLTVSFQEKMRFLKTEAPGKNPNFFFQVTLFFLWFVLVKVLEKRTAFADGYSSYNKSTECNNENILRKQFSLLQHLFFFCSFLGQGLPWLKASQLAGSGAQPRSFLQFLSLGQMKCGLAPSGSFSIQNNWSLERKMQLITMPVATTPLARKALMWYLIVFVSW